MGYNTDGTYTMDPREWGSNGVTRPVDNSCPPVRSVQVLAEGETKVHVCAAEPNVPLDIQVRLLDGVDNGEPGDLSEWLSEIIGENWGDLLRMSDERLRSGYEQYGSRMYGWDAATRLRNVLEELADVRVYLSSGSIDREEPEAPEYPSWICADCGSRIGVRECGIATWHDDLCDVCGRRATVTEPRDFGGLVHGWQNMLEE